ncbi:MAG: hypothetical protein OEW75_12405, partial [Cyclobacteriaceae bacterium]|nr:hypothetical protein [Cyclobacteriaceae bacterium]
MKVNPQQADEYLLLEKEWKKVHLERVKVGVIIGWYLYKVRFAGTDSPYQYVTISIYKQFDDSENLFFEGVFEKAWKNQDIQSLLDKTDQIRNQAKSEVFIWVDGTSIDFNDPAKFLYMNFISVPQGEENKYIEIEKYSWKPMHEELQKTRQMASWNLWNLWFYTHNNYRYITMNAFYEYDDIDSYNYSEIFQKVHQGKDLNMLMQNTNLTRISNKTELWELIDYISK